jgi:hypothetical protein
VRLHPDDIEAVAQRTVELLAQRATDPQPRYLDAKQLARALGVRRDWVYAHARQLGAIRLGSSARGRLRFDLQHATRTLADPRHTAQADRPPRRSSHQRVHRRAGVDLLPYES